MDYAIKVFSPRLSFGSFFSSGHSCRLSWIYANCAVCRRFNPRPSPPDSESMTASTPGGVLQSTLAALLPPLSRSSPSLFVAPSRYLLKSVSPTSSLTGMPDYISQRGFKQVQDEQTRLIRDAALSRLLSGPLTLLHMLPNQKIHGPSSPPSSSSSVPPSQSSPVQNSLRVALLGCRSEATLPRHWWSELFYGLHATRSSLDPPLHVTIDIIGDEGETK